MERQSPPSWFDPHVDIRADIYVLLAALLVQPPAEDRLRILQDLQWNEDIPAQVHRALECLKHSGGDYLPAAVEDEYNRLFVGLGRGELIPYASWYREKAIQSRPLASLRSDLIRLGIVRQTDHHDSEDHAAALCEIMAIISRKSNNVSSETQAAFFQEHIAPWMAAFFRDIKSAKSAGFYQAVGSLGEHFLESESQYLEYWANTPEPT